MKIKSVYISAFGGLEDKKIDFSDGFNVIYGENENGKTTLMNFIKAVFYGSGRGSAQVSKNLRKKYTPWSGKTPAGSVDFVLNGVNYRLERQFKGSDATDKITLINLDLGESKPVQTDIGLKLLGISTAAFERSVFIGQTSIESDSAAEGELNSKLSNIVATGDESVSFETVNSNLSGAKSQLTTSRGVGIYDKNLKKIAQLKDKLNTAENVYSEYENFKINAETYTKKTDNDIKRAAELKKQIDNEQNIRNAEKLREMLEAKAELEKINDELKLSDGSIADDNFARKIELCIEKVKNAEKALNERIAEEKRIREGLLLQNGSAETKEIYTNLDNIRKQLDIKTEKYNSLLADREKVKKSRKKINLPLVFLSLLPIILSLVLFIIGQAVVGICALAVGVILLVSGFIIRPYDKNKIERFGNTVNALKNEIDNLKLQETEWENKLSATEKQDELLSDYKKNIEDSKTALENERETLFNLFGKYRKTRDVVEIAEELLQIKKRAEIQKEIKQRLNYIAKDIGNISYEEAKEKLKSAENLSGGSLNFKSLKAEYENLCNTIADKKQQLAIAKNSAKAKLENIENPENIKKEIEDLEETALSQAEFCKAVDIAMAVLKDSFGELRRGYGSELEKRASEVLSGITDGKYRGMEVSKSFEINAEKSGVFGAKEIAFLSDGTKDQAYLSLRLALSSLIFGKGDVLPILLDDSLSQYDDLRTKTAVEYLKKHSEKGQIIMFTCHNSVLEIAEKAGADCRHF